MAEFIESTMIARVKSGEIRLLADVPGMNAGGGIVAFCGACAKAKEQPQNINVNI